MVSFIRPLSYMTLLVLTCLALSSISNALPLSSASIEPRSPSPAHYTGSDDIVSDVLASLGFTNLAKLNHWKNWADSEYPDVIDDSNSTQPTNTEHGNENSKVKDVMKEQHSELTNPATDPFGFVSGIFGMLSNRFSEAKNSGDEHTLN